jgi:hypothetical protein
MFLKACAVVPQQAAALSPCPAASSARAIHGAKSTLGNRVRAVDGFQDARIFGAKHCCRDELSYGPDTEDQYRRVAIASLKAEMPADLPVQHPTKYHLVINLKTAKALGVTVSPSLLSRADEVIE